MFRVPNKYRVTTGKMGSTDAIGNAGAFIIPIPHSNISYCVIASDGGGWDHVSVHIDGLARAPLWSEMCTIKALFWDAEDCVMQLHPPESEYINCHPYTLHLWRPQGKIIPRPPVVFV